MKGKQILCDGKSDTVKGEKRAVEKRDDARQYIAAFISAEDTEDAVSLQGD